MAAYPMAVQLKDWYLRRLGKDEAGGVRVAVEGMRCDERAGASLNKSWHSSAIYDRSDSSTLVTRSGSVYVLVGPMLPSPPSTAGLSPHTVAAFASGFPPDWRHHLTHGMPQAGYTAEHAVGHAPDPKPHPRPAQPFYSYRPADASAAAAAGGGGGTLCASSAVTPSTSSVTAVRACPTTAERACPAAAEELAVVVTSETVTDDSAIGDVSAVVYTCTHALS